MIRHLKRVFQAVAPVCVLAALVTPALAQQRPPTPIQPTDPGRLRPLVPQSTLPIDSFRVSQERCTAALDGGSVLMSARLRIAPGTSTSGLVDLDILVDGVSVYRGPFRVSNGAVTFSRRIPVQGGAGEHEVVFVLDGRVRSSPQNFSHACARQTGVRVDPPTSGLVLPNLGFGNTLQAQYAPAPNSADFARSLGVDVPHIAPRDRLPADYRFTNPVILRDPMTAAGVLRFPASPACRAETDPPLWVVFAIGLDNLRVADPEPYVLVEGLAVANTWVVDALDQPRLFNGRLADPGRGGSLEAGRAWLVVHAQLACTRDGRIVISLDPHRRMRETNEADNMLRIRYATLP